MRRVASKASMLTLVLILAFSNAMTGCVEDDEEPEGNDEPIITVNGEEFTFDELFDLFGTKTITVDDEDYEGIPLHLIVQVSGVATPAERQYRITAFDAYSKDVTWDDMTRGVLMEEEMRTVFPGLPGKYRVRDVVTIDPVTVNTLLVGDHLYTWDQPFDLLDTVDLTVENESYSGVPLGDLVNLTITSPDGFDYRLVAEDSHERTVNWTSLASGVMLKDTRQAVFPELERSYWVSDIVMIEAVT